MKKITLRFVGLIFFMMFYGTADAKDCGANVDPCGKKTAWNEFETIQLRLKQDGMPVPVSWYVQSSRKNSDLQVDIDFPDHQTPQRGTIMMVEGTTLVSRGIVLPPGREIDALDWPILSAILTGKVLSRALPNGPALLSGRKQIMHHDKKTGIQFATPSAQGFIPPPWSVTGFVVSNSDGSIDFDLVLKWTRKVANKSKKVAAMAFSGQLRHKADFQIDNNMSLEGWSVFGVGPIVEIIDGGTRIDYGAKPSKTLPRTISDIRKEIADQNSPGEPDLSLNFAGFWKGKCSDTFGLRIKPVDKPGMYTVTFCGPGGCGDEQDERKTFIKGDKNYNVVSSTELQVGPADDRSTYNKCSDDMLP